jgi:hypothetical protein
LKGTSREAHAPKLFEMIVAGFPEERAQLIFDALIHAEERGCQFVNVCLRHDIGFLFSNDRDEADSQLGKWRSLVKCDAIGLRNAGDTWEERTP